MEQTSDQTHSEVAAEQGESAPSFSVGSTLREARERMGLSVSDVVNRLKFAPRQIKALEEDDFAQLPEAAFLRGFVRSYARLLQLDDEPLLAALPDTGTRQSVTVERQSVEVPFPSIYTMRRLNIIWLVAALVVALALGLFTWLHDKEGRVPHRKVEVLSVPLAAVQSQPASAVKQSVAMMKTLPAPAMKQPAAAAAKAAPVAVAPAKTPPGVPGMIHMTFDEDCWVEIKDKDGNVLLSQINPSGSEQNINGNPPFSLVIGHASGVKLSYKGKPVDLAPYTSVEVARLTLE